MGNTIVSDSMRWAFLLLEGGKV